MCRNARLDISNGCVESRTCGEGVAVFCAVGKMWGALPSVNLGSVLR